MAKLALVYGMLLFPADELGEVSEAPITLKDGRSAWSFLACVTACIFWEWASAALRLRWAFMWRFPCWSRQSE